MKEIIFALVSGALGFATFGLIARKYGKDCIP